MYTLHMSHNILEILKNIYYLTLKMTWASFILSGNSNSRDLELEALGLVSGKAEMKNEDICFHSLGYK